MWFWFAIFFPYWVLWLVLWYGCLAVGLGFKKNWGFCFLVDCEFHKYFLIWDFQSWVCILLVLIWLCACVWKGFYVNFTWKPDWVYFGGLHNLVSIWTFYCDSVIYCVSHVELMDLIHKCLHGYLLFVWYRWLRALICCKLYLINPEMKYYKIQLVHMHTIVVYMCSLRIVGIFDNT